MFHISERNDVLLSYAWINRLDWGFMHRLSYIKITCLYNTHTHIRQRISYKRRLCERPKQWTKFLLILEPVPTYWMPFRALYTLFKEGGKSFLKIELQYIFCIWFGMNISNHCKSILPRLVGESPTPYIYNFLEFCYRLCAFESNIKLLSFQFRI